MALLIHLYLVLFSSVAHAGSDKMNLDALINHLRSSSGNVIQPNASQISQCSKKDCAKWTSEHFGKSDYWDVAGGNLDDSQVQQLFEVHWDPSAHGNQSFLDHEEQQYSSYEWRSSDLRYTLPFTLYGWTNLDHPPLRSVNENLADIHPMLGAIDRSSDHRFYDADFQHSLDQLSQTELTAGNVLSLLPNTNSYQQKLALIKATKHHLWVTSMVFFCDDSSGKLIDAMKERIQNGVEVRLIVEGVWSRIALNGCIARMRDVGIDVLIMNESLQIKNPANITHNKFWIRDGEEAIVGGQNIMDAENLSTGFNAEGYRDTDAWVHSGPITTELEQKFAFIWEKNRKKANKPMGDHLVDIQNKLYQEALAGQRGEAVYTALSDPSRRSHGFCRLVSQEPGASEQAISPVLAALADASSSLVIATTPRVAYKEGKSDYKSPKLVYDALINAGNRGVRVDVVTNGSDGFGGTLTKIFRTEADKARSKGQHLIERGFMDVADDLGRANYATSMKDFLNFSAQSQNIHPWTYFRFAHQKVHLFDRRMVGIGSFNLDTYSSKGNRETELLCMDEDLISQAERQLAQDISNSIPVRK